MEERFVRINSNKFKYFAFSSRNILQAMNAQHFKKYFLICTILPFILSIYILSELGEISIESLIKQRYSPAPIFEKETVGYMKLVGIVEIVVKTVTLLFFIGSFIKMKRQENDLTDAGVQVVRPKNSKCER